MRNDVTVVLFSNDIKLKILTRKILNSYIFYQRSHTVILADLSNAVNKVLDQISFRIKHFNELVLKFQK